MDKEKISEVMIIGLLVVVLIISGYGFYLENKYNSCVVKFNECSNNCSSVFKENKFEYKVNMGEIPDGIITKG